ncbi:MAG: 16S rRNA (guanine(527)-N(7))-methyltransferase RsmG [Pseudomonadales bacterium]
MEPRQQLSSQLESGARNLGLSLTDQQICKLLDYLFLIEKWNRAYNLTAIREPQEMLSLHLLDSLSIFSLVKDLVPGTRLLDVGTGAGLPGMVLAIMNPAYQVSLMDTNGKKCRFLRQVGIELELDNIQVIHDRVEKYQAFPLFDAILSRAFATLKDMTDNAVHLLAEGGRFLAMKGRYPQQELDELNQQFSFEKAYPLQIPGLDVERFLIEIAVNR